MSDAKDNRFYREPQPTSNAQLADELEAADVETILESDLLDRVCTALRATHEPSDVRPLVDMDADDFTTCLAGVLVSTQMPESVRIYLNEARNRLMQRTSPPPSAVLVNAFRAGAFYGCAEEFNPLDLQRDAEAYGSRHSPTKEGGL